MTAAPTLHDYQRVAAEAMIENECFGLFLDPGLGKTLTTIHALDTLRLLGEVGRVLLIAPLRVARDTWPAELEKWAALHSFTHALAVGSPEKRRRALDAGADITIVNVDTAAWLLDEYPKPRRKADARMPFDTLVVDELSIYKGRKSSRFKALQARVPEFRRRYGLTGTPAATSLMDLWSQMGVVDNGASLGRSFTKFRGEHFALGMMDNGLPKDHRFDSSFELLDGAEEAIFDAIRPRVLSMRAADHLDLPPVTYNYAPIPVPPSIDKARRAFIREKVLPGTEVTAANAAVLAGKLLQFNSGMVYDDERVPLHVHDLKHDWIVDTVEGLQGSPVLIFYGYQHERDRLLNAIPGAEEYVEGSRERWNRGEIPALLLHPKSAGHGLNLQEGGHTIIWATPTWSAELWIQGNGRVNRQGQTKPVVIHVPMLEGTIDDRVMSVVDGREKRQDGLFRAVRASV